MIIELLIFIPIFIISLFFLYVFSRQDFVLLRQNISLSQIFDLAAITLLFSVIFARIFTIADEFKFELLNVLAFLHVLRFPGFSMLGIFFGGALGILLFARNHKNLPRIFDIFSLSFYPSYIFFFSKELYQVGLIALIPLLVILLLLLFSFFVQSHKKYTLRDGAISSIFLFVFSLSSFLVGALSKSRHALLFSLTFSQIVCIPIILLSILFFLKIQRARR